MNYFKPRITTQTAEGRAGLPALHLGIVCGKYDVFVIPKFRADGSPLAWVTNWSGGKHHQSFMSPKLANRVVAHALKGLDFGVRQ